MNNSVALRISYFYAQESVFGLRSGSLASNTDESYNPDIGSETESRASDRRLSAEIGRW